MFSRRIDVSPGLLKTAVEVIVGKDGEKPGSGTKLWCGMGSGEVRIVDFETGKPECTLKPHNQLVTCLLIVDDEIWTGSFDKTIKIIKGRKVVGCLTGHTDAVTALVKGDGDTVWSCSLNGQLLKWNIKTRLVASKLDFKLQSPETGRTLPVYSFQMINGRLWCATGNLIRVVDPETLTVLHRLPGNSNQPTLDPQGLLSPVVDVTPRRNTAPSRGEARDAIKAVLQRNANPKGSPQIARPGSAPRKGLSSSYRPPFLPNKREEKAGGDGDDDYTIPMFSSELFEEEESKPLPQSPRKHTPLRSSPLPFNQSHSHKSPGRNSFRSNTSPPKPLPFSTSPPKPIALPFAVKTTAIPFQHSGSDRDRHRDRASPRTPMSKPLFEFQQSTAEKNRTSPQPGDKSRSNSITSSTSKERRNSKNRSNSISSLHPLRNAVSHDNFEELTDFVPRKRTTSMTSQPDRPRAMTSWHIGGAVTVVSPGKRYVKPQTTQTVDTAADYLIEGVVGEVWSCSDKVGVVHVWDAEKLKLLSEWRLDCGGIISLLYTRQSVWGAAQNGSLYIWDAVSHNPVMEVRSHSDAIRCLAFVGNEVLSGSSRRDGTICVWQTFGRGRQCTRATTAYVGQPFGLAHNQVLSYDRYGFQQVQSTVEDEGALSLVASLPDDKRIQFEANSKLEQQHERSWGEFRSQNPEITSKTDDLRDLVRGGIPPRFRFDVWVELIDSWILDQKQSLGADYYKTISNITNKSDVPQQIELDLLRTFPYNKFFNGRSSTGINKLRRVLYAFSQHNKTISYCQGFNFIAGFALIFLQEEDAFWCIVALIERIVHPGYYVHPMIVSRADQLVLQDLLGNICPRLKEKLDDAGIDITIVTFHWFFTLFVDCVPTHTSLMIWDTLLFEGDHVLFRYALTICQLNEENILKLEDRAEIFTYIKCMSKDITDLRVLQQMAFSYDLATLGDLRKAKQQAVEDEEEAELQAHLERKARIKQPLFSADQPHNEACLSDHTAKPEDDEDHSSGDESFRPDEDDKDRASPQSSTKSVSPLPTIDEAMETPDFQIDISETT